MAWDKLVKPLTEAQKKKFHQKIVEGTSSALLTKLLLEKFDLGKDETYHNFYRKVDRYAKRYLKENTVEKALVSVTPEQVEGYQKNYNALEKLTNLCKLQEERITKVIKKENALGDNGLLMKQVTDEIKNMSFMLKDLADVQMKAGVIPLAPKVLPETVLDKQDNKDTITIKVTDDLRKALEEFDAIKEQIDG